jgi:lysophospholipase L1-like esterase
VIGLRAFRTAAVAAGALGGLSGAAYGLLSEQSRRARRVIGIPGAPPPSADGVYLPDGSGPLPVTDPRAGARPLVFGVVGDSTAAGLGVDAPEQLPGVLLAHGLAEETGRPVRLDTYAISGSTTRHLHAQVDAALVDPPDLVLVIIGANDVTTRLRVGMSAALLGVEVERLRAIGTAVVVGTCPDLGAIQPIPQPLRSIVRSWSLALAKAQRQAVQRAGGVAVPLADLLACEFLARPAELFSADRFHPSAAGYPTAVSVLLPAVCSSLGASIGGLLPAAPILSDAAEARRPTARLIARLNRLIGRAQPEIP